MEIEKLDTRTLNNGTSMPIGKNFFRAKLKDRKQWIEGFYCRINETTYWTIVGNIFDNPGLLGIKRTGE